MLQLSLQHKVGSFDLDVAFESGSGITALFGRSGAGKTTIINAIAGLIQPIKGRIVIGEHIVLDTTKAEFIPAHRRAIGYIFQEGRLFPHLNVRQNLNFGRWLRSTRTEIAQFDDIVSLLGLEALLERRPTSLSGGEQRRVAIGRALLANPRLLLLDEPLVNLDRARADEILPFIERLRDEVRLPMIYVSHSVPEVARLADRIILLSNGRVSATGSTADILSRLDLFPMTGRHEAGGLLDGQIIAHDTNFALTRLTTRAGELSVPALNLPVGHHVRLRIRARDIILARQRPTGLSTLNILPVRILDIRADDSAAADLLLDCAGDRLLARITRKSISDLDLKPGDAVFALVKSVALDRRSFGHIPTMP